MRLSRRHLLGGAATCAILAGDGALLPFRFVRQANANIYGETAPFSRERLRGAAEALSKQPYVDRRSEIPQDVLNIGYSAYRSIRMGEGWPAALSGDGRFAFDALPGGFVFNQPVDLWVVSGETAQRVVFDRANFRFDPPADTEVPPGNLPFSGFRLRTQMQEPGVLSEFIVFQGASYFRAVGIGEQYGLSARGLAIDTGAVTGEEFPVFRSFWIERAGNDAKAVTVHALLDSPSTTGVYRITTRPGDATVSDVEVTLFPRREIGGIGFAPFSSMFLFDGMNRNRFDDYRAAVHDSDGLSILTGTGEWIWRPLNNHRLLQVSAFVDNGPRGFGLVQRKRDYEDYYDAEARYELRPTAWVEPIGNWGEGSIVLFEIPTDSETNDNVVAYWQPARPVPANQAYDVTYRIHWDARAAGQTDGPLVRATRQGKNLHDNRRLFVVDYDMRGRSFDATAEVRASVGKVSNITQYPTPEANILRVSFELDPDGADLVELTLTLLPAEGPPAERWLYRWTS